MQKYLYLSLIPEALVFSQLPPDLYGRYLAIGDKKLTSGPAIFFEIDAEFETEHLQLKAAADRCIPHHDGSARRSSYVSVYGALANIPISAIKNLFLTTKDGITLTISPQAYEEKPVKGLHLYQELCPVYPKVASPLEPKRFSKYVTNPKNPISLPRIVFAELRLDGLATDPEKNSSENLPYKNINHLRECLTSLKYNSTKLTKIVHRDFNNDLIYPVISTGFYIGDQIDFTYYPMPNEESLENEHHSWWSSATSVSRF